MFLTSVHYFTHRENITDIIIGSDESGDIQVTTESTTGETTAQTTTIPSTTTIPLTSGLFCFVLCYWS